MTRRLQRSKGHVTGSRKRLPGLVAKEVWSLDELDAEGAQAFLESLPRDDLVTRQLAAFEAYAVRHAPRDADRQPIAALGYQDQTPAPDDSESPINAACAAADVLWWIELVRAERERGRDGAALAAFAALSGKFVELVVLVNERGLLISAERERRPSGNQKYSEAQHDEWWSVAREHAAERLDMTGTNLPRRELARHVIKQDATLDDKAQRSIENALAQRERWCAIGRDHVATRLEATGSKPTLREVALYVLIHEEALDVKAMPSIEHALKVDGIP